VTRPSARPAARGDRASRVVPLAVGGAAVVLFLAFATGLVLDWPTDLLGLALGLALLGAAYAVGQLRRPGAERPARPDEWAPGDAPLAAAVARHPVRRRWVLGGVGLGAVASLGLLAWLGRDDRPQTAWRRGVHLVTDGGMRIRAADVPVGGFATVWPEGAVRSDLAAVVLVRLSGQVAQPPTVLDWVVGERIVAYSKVCTHAGCPVGLFLAGTDRLFCPCHQATFDAARGAVPVFGPAARPLPQLPLGVDDDGLLVATGDFPLPVGPVRG
jgi:ubiquinol-cytochrome c reductase iron-sulfur subunit